MRVAPINIELCRYGLARIPVEERVCSHCNEVEDELHVLMKTVRYMMTFVISLLYQLII